MGNASVHSRILVLGIENAGKTSFLDWYQFGSSPESVAPTEAYVIRHIKVKSVKLHVWDVSGKKATRSLWKHYYTSEEGTDAIIWVIDGASSQEELEESCASLENPLMDPSLKGVLLYVLVNKNDLDHCRSVQEIIKTFNLYVHLLKRPIFIQSISCKTGNGIKESMAELSKEIKAQKSRIQPNPTSH